MTRLRARRITSRSPAGGLCLSLALWLSACGATPVQQASLISGVSTLGAVAAARNTTVASLVTKGALFCQRAEVDGPLVVALANASGVPVSVTGAGSEAVADACGAISAIPVPAPVDVGSTPVVMAPNALAAAVKP